MDPTIPLEKKLCDICKTDCSFFAYGWDEGKYYCVPCHDEKEMFQDDTELACWVVDHGIGHRWVCEWDDAPARVGYSIDDMGLNETTAYGFVRQWITAGAFMEKHKQDIEAIIALSAVSFCGGSMPRCILDYGRENFK